MGTILELPIDLGEDDLAEIKQELAVVLYKRRLVSLAKGASIAGLTRLEFQRMLAERRVPLQITETDVIDDLQRLRALHERR